MSSTSQGTRTDKLKQMLCESLDENDFEPDSVDVMVSSSRLDNIIFVVGKYIDGEMVRIKYALGHTVNSTTNNNMLAKEVANIARVIVEDFRERLITTIKLSGTRVQVSEYSGGWAKCDRCGEEITLLELQQPTPIMEGAELSNPEPQPYNTHGVSRRLDDAQQMVLRLYLLGALRNRCCCDFGKRMGETFRKI